MSDYDIYKFRDKYKHVKSIAFVGNSSSVLSYENGELIDSYEMVVRYNRAYVKGIEKNVGRRTTVLVSNDINNLHRSSSPKEILDPEFVVAFTKPKAEADLTNLIEWVGDIPFVLTLAPDLYNLGHGKRTRSLTMGTYSLYTFLRFFKPERIFITGFTMFGIAPGGGEKYFEKGEYRNVGEFHDLDEEAIIFRSILKQFNGEINATPEVQYLLDQNNKSKSGNKISIKMIAIISKVFLNIGFRLRRIIEKHNTFNQNNSLPKN